MPSRQLARRVVKAMPLSVRVEAGILCRVAASRNAARTIGARGGGTWGDSITPSGVRCPVSGARWSRAVHTVGLTTDALPTRRSDPVGASVAAPRILTLPLGPEEPPTESCGLEPQRSGGAHECRQQASRQG